MKSDISFLLQGTILTQFSIPLNSNTFTITASRHRNDNFNRGISEKPSLNILLKKSSRVNTRSAEKYIGITPPPKKLAPLITKKKLIDEFIIDRPEEPPKTDRLSQYESSDEDETELKSRDNLKISKEISEELLISFVDQICFSITIEAFKEMINAALVLFTSSVLDKYLTEVLSEMIPLVAWQALQEITDTEYIDFQIKILMSVMEEELLTVSRECGQNEVAELIAEDYSYDIPMDKIAIEAISEEKE